MPSNWFPNCTDPSAHVDLFDLSTGDSKTFPNLYEARGFLSVGAANGVALFAGGQTYVNTQCQICFVVQQWSLVSLLFAQVADKLICGLRNDGVSNRVDTYIIASGTLSPKTLTISPARFGIAVATYGNWLFFSGGLYATHVVRLGAY